MARFIKLATLSLCLLSLLFSGCGIDAAQELPAAEEAAVESIPEHQVIEQDAPSKYGRSFLSQEGQQVYDQLFGLAVSLDDEGKAPIPPGFTEEEIMTLLGYFVDDNPAFYWLRPHMIADSGSRGRYVGFQYRPGMDADKVREQEAMIRQEAARLLQGLEGEPADIVEAVHDRLALLITYDIATDIDNLGNLYGGLVNRSGVCDAYAKSFQYLMDMSGIPCIYIRGTNNRGRSHAWNAVELDNQWYYVDVTWDDMENLRHNYLNVSSEEIGREHFWDAAQYPRLPESEPGDYDYYRRGGYLVSPGNEAALVAEMAEAFAGQLTKRAAFDGEEIFLEIKIHGTDKEYDFAKDIFIANVFVIRDRMNGILTRNGATVRVREEDTLSCNYNDAMRILSFFPTASVRLEEQ